MAVFAAAILTAGSALAATVPAQSLLAVSFSDSTHGYIAGGYSGTDGVLAYTSDGGVTWKPAQFPNRRTWAVASSTDGSSATASADYFDVAIATTNNGGTWASGTPVFGGVQGFGGTSHINDVAYLSGGRVAVGQQQGTVNNGNVAVTAREISGVWTPDFFPLYPPLIDGTPVWSYATLNSIDATAGGSIAWAVGAEYSLPQNASVKSSLIYRTIDGGVTWTPDLTTGALTNEITAVTAADSDEAYATYQSAGLGSRYFLRRSPAGVWSRSASQIAVGFQSNALDAYDADHLVVVGDLGRVYYTANATNANPTWVPLLTTNPTNNLYGVQMTGPDSWVVVGGNETIVRFTNGGASQAGSYGLTPPVPVIVAPTSGFARPVAAINGTAFDTGTGVLKVEVRIQRANGQYWNGSTWVTDPTGNQWKLATGTTSWSYPFSSPETSDLTIGVRATDGMGLQATTAVSSSLAVYKNVYRFRNLQNGFYLWSADENEKATIIATLANTWKYEGVAYKVNTANALNQSPLWRFVNIRGGYYLYTANPAEKATIIANLSGTWRYEGPAYKVSTNSSGSPVWRFRNLQNGTYLYSADPNEKNTIVATLKTTWLLEGPAYYLAP
jgi:hypothetical protein